MSVGGCLLGLAGSKRDEEGLGLARAGSSCVGDPSMCVTGACVLLHNFLIDVKDTHNEHLQLEFESRVKEAEATAPTKGKRKISSEATKKRLDLLKKLTGWEAPS